MQNSQNNSEGTADYAPEIPGLMRNMGYALLVISIAESLLVFETSNFCETNPLTGA